MNLTLVDAKKLKYDPRKLPYLYPSMSGAAYKWRADEYYRLLSLKALEQVAKMFGAVALPSSCVTYRRKQAARRVELFGHAYYITPISELTGTEITKYRAIAREVEAFGQTQER